MDKYIGRLLDNRYEILDVIGTGVWLWCTGPVVTGSIGWWPLRF